MTEPMPAAQPELISEGFLWDVFSFAFPFGSGRRLGTVRAPTRTAAECAARALYRTDVLVSPAA